MTSSTSSPVEVMALKNAYDHLIKSIDATSMASHLFKAGIITQRQYEECRGEKLEKVEKMLEYLLKVVSSDPAKFYTFQRLLHRTNNLAIASKLRGQFIRGHLNVQMHFKYFYPVRVCVAGLCVWFMYVCMYVCMYNWLRSTRARHRHNSTTTHVFN